MEEFGITNLVCLMALRASVEKLNAVIADKKLGTEMVFTEDFKFSSYFAVAYIIFIILGALIKSYRHNVRIFDEGKMIAGFLFCGKLILELFSERTIDRLFHFTKWFTVALIFVSVIGVVLYNIRTIYSTDLTVFIREHPCKGGLIVIGILGYFGALAALIFETSNYDSV